MQTNPNATPEMVGFQQDLASYGKPDGTWEAIKNIGRAAWNNKTGAAHTVISQIPNSGVVMGSAGVGAAVGGALTLGSPIGIFVGGLAGMMFGNTTVETGAFANQKAMEDGEYSRGDVIKGGVVKGGVITAVDSLTLGATKWLTGSAGRAAMKATEQVLVKNGINVADKTAVQMAFTDARIVREATKAAEMAAAAAEKSTGIVITSYSIHYTKLYDQIISMTF